MKRKKILIIRFSSFGDIVQAMSVLPNLSTDEVHWLTKLEFRDLVAASPLIHKVWTLPKKAGLIDLIKLFWEVKKTNFNIVYDAHRNLRSFFIVLLFRICTTLDFIITRPKERFKRFLLFYLRLNLLPIPYKGIRSYLAPLSEFSRDTSYQNQKWNFSLELQNKVQQQIPVKEFIVMAPSAAWQMKRWPLAHWKKLIQLTSKDIIILGGPGDDFCDQLQAIDPSRVHNLAGKLSLLESCYLLTLAEKLISADTGMLHVADLLNIPAVALIGPTAFGFTTGNHIKTLEVELPCRPCTKDGRG